MRVVTPQIAFHGRDGGKNDPILSVDVHPTEYVVATGGGDNHVKLWSTCFRQKDNDAETPLTFLSTLEGHQKSVNVVRFSPNGNMLASASDDGVICVWTLRPSVSLSETSKWIQIREEKQLLRTTLRRHGCDIYDIAWSADSTSLISGGVDNNVILWKIPGDGGKAKSVQILDNHSHYVQGVAWDPFQQYFVTQSCDRTCRIYACGKPFPSKKARDERGLRKFDQVYVLERRSLSAGSKAAAAGSKATHSKAAAADSKAAGSKATVAEPIAAADSNLTSATDPKKEPKTEPTTEPKEESPTRSSDNDDQPCKQENAGPVSAPNSTSDQKPAPLKRKTERLFLDDSVPTFFRRPGWSPDGNLLVVPTAQHTLSQDDSIISANSKAPTPTTFVFLRDHWNQPAAHLPGCSKPSIVARFSPKFYTLRRSPGDAALVSPTPWVTLEYRMVFFVVTMASLVVYDTQHPHPIAVASNIHFAQLTDASWSPDGSSIILASQDGYCSVVLFENGELGEEFTAVPAILPVVLDDLTEAAKKRAAKQSEKKEAAADKQPHKKEANSDENQQACSNLSDGIANNKTASPKQPPVAPPTVKQPAVNTLQPRRIAPSLVAASDSTTNAAKKRILPTPLPQDQPSKELPKRITPQLLQAVGPVATATTNSPVAKKQQQQSTPQKKRRIEPTLLVPLSN